MNRNQKTEVVSDLEQKLDGAGVTLLASFRGLTSNQVNQLRREIRDADGEYRVTKNTLTRRAFGARANGNADAWLAGPTALVFGFGDPIQVTKVVAKWAESEPEKFTIKGGLFEGEILDEKGVVALSKTPARETLLAQLLALLQTPSTQLVRVLSEPGTAAARVLAARRDALESQSS